MISAHRQLLLLLLFVLMTSIAGGGGTAAQASEWNDAVVGAPVPAPVVISSGSHSFAEGALTITGGGGGINVAGADHCQFAYQQRVAGDWQIVARLKSFTGEGGAVAGLMVRSDDDANPAMAEVCYQAKDQVLSWMSRVPAAKVGAPARIFSSAIKLIGEPPLWLKLISHGSNVAAYKSRDGKNWVMISNTSGGPLALTGAIRIGCFVASSDDAHTVSATFDSIAIGAAAMPYKTSWVGNTFGCRDSDNHVSNTLSAMWVAADGTCFTSSYWDEAGQPVTSYKDGKVVGGLPIGTPQTYEGGITGDAANVYVAWVDRIMCVDRANPSAEPRPMMMSVSLYDPITQHSVVSGLASNGQQLFVADARENRIRVMDVKPVPTYHVATAANDGIALAPAPVVVPTNDPRFAPALVYQSQRVGEGTKYTLPGLTVGSTYTIRCHFVEYVTRAADCDPRNRIRRFNSSNNEDIDVAALAGGVMKPLVKDFPGYVADATGRIVMETSSYGGTGICGLEVLNATGEQVLAINCGGPAVGKFTSECQELIANSFACDRPGAMIFDARGDLWIIQRGNDFPIGISTTAKFKASIKCYTTAGTFTGREITDVVNPRGLGYDAAKDRLLVADNGPDQQVRIYSGLSKTPTLASTLGERGGIFSGTTPGLINDPATGPRFAGLAGVGVDSSGHVYVGGGFQGTDLRQINPNGTTSWMLNSLMFCATYDVDPDSDGRDIYGTYNHLRLDLAKTAPGSEQNYRSYNWDLNRSGLPVRPDKSQAILRRLGTNRQLVMYTTGQGLIENINIYRYQGEIAIPAGGTRDNGKILWIDTNEDGIEDPAERTVMTTELRCITHLCVEPNGDMWITDATSGSFVRHFQVTGLSPKGVPLYQGTSEGYTDTRFPEEGDKTSAWGMTSRFEYDAARDIAIAYYPLVGRTGDNDHSPKQYAMARYDHWKTGNRTPTWKNKVFSPDVNPDYFMYERDLYPYSGYMGTQVMGDYIFTAYLFGEIQVIDLKTGALVQTLPHGPEVAAGCAWEDASMGLRAFRCSSGEYMIFTESSGWGGKNHFIRWKP